MLFLALVTDLTSKPSIRAQTLGRLVTAGTTTNALAVLIRDLVLGNREASIVR
jgi:hypothetical protein